MAIEVDGARRERITAVALQYFRENSGFARLFEGFKAKYASFGYVGGTVQITAIKETEKSALSGFLGKDLSKRKTVSISAETFQKVIDSSRFEGITVEDLVNAYFAGELVYKKHTREKEILAQQDFFRRLIETAKGDGKTIQWVQGIIMHKHTPHNQIMQEYNENPQVLFTLLSNVMKGISQLPEVEATTDVEAETRLATNTVAGNVSSTSPGAATAAVRLPVFAASITGDPHYFDKGAKAYSYLLHGIYYRLFGVHMENAALNAEEESELLYRAGLMKDDLSNFVMCFGIRGSLKPAVGSWPAGVENESAAENKWKTTGSESVDAGNMQEGDLGSAASGAKIPHLGLEEFFHMGEPVMLSLRNLNRLSGAYAAAGKVFVVENPAVFGSVIGTDGGEPLISAVCSAGQPNLAVLVLLDMLAA